MVEWSITAVLKTVELKGSGGSNPSLSANHLKLSAKRWAFFVQGRQELAPVRACAKKPIGRQAVSFKWFARAPRRAGRDVGALCATKSRTLPQIHFGKDNIGDSIFKSQNREFCGEKLKMSL